jgi:hypothetical protein
VHPIRAPTSRSAGPPTRGTTSPKSLTPQPLRSRGGLVACRSISVERPNAKKVLLLLIYQLTENVFVQETIARASAMQVEKSPQRKLELNHIVNFYDSAGTEDRTQELTADSMREAKQRVRKVRLIAVVSRDQQQAIPRGFKGVNLNRTVVDTAQFSKHRPLPLLFDILERGAAACRADSYLVFSNTDICLQPYFYGAVHSLITHGFDCLIINRRTVASIEDYGAWTGFSALESGESHPGLDCFVFPTEWVGRFIRSNACVGVGYVMRSLLFNLVVLARRMLIMRDVHLTYHFGDDRRWDTAEFEEYQDHNVAQARFIFDTLSVNPRHRKVLWEFCKAHGEILPDGPLGDC